MYSCAVLRNHHHRKSWRASIANMPGFPQRINHYDCTLVESVNALHLEVFQNQKYEGWPDYDEAVAVKRLPFGIIPLTEDCGRQGKACEHLSPQCGVIHTLHSSGNKGGVRSLQKITRGNTWRRISSQPRNLSWVDNDMEPRAREAAELQERQSQGLSKIYLTLHYKKWRITNKKRAARH
jgi:hypothetical protein